MHTGFLGTNREEKRTSEIYRLLISPETGKGYFFIMKSIILCRYMYREVSILLISITMHDGEFLIHSLWHVELSKAVY